MEGILLFDKDVGMSSNAALQRVKKKLQLKKAGHTGSLDPFASGLLPICIGKATRVSRFLLSADKTYLVTAKLGISTDSGDCTGNVIFQQLLPSFTKEEINACLLSFLGKSLQIPPMHSALKKDGVPLYKLARQGVTIDREAREIDIKSIELIAINGDEVEFIVTCSKGTYIRSLVIDFGKKLNCGAHTIKLRRISSAGYNIADACSLEQLDLKKVEKFVRPVDDLFIDWPKIKISSEQERDFLHGKDILAPYLDTIKSGEWFCLYSTPSTILALLKLDSNQQIADRVFLGKN